MIDKIFVYRDKDGKNRPVGSDTEAVSFHQFKTSITPMMRTFNISSIWGGVYELTSAIGKVAAKLTDNQKTPGIHLEFTNSSGEFEQWEFKGGTFTDLTSWYRCDTSVLAELEKATFPITLNFSTSTGLLAVGSSQTVTLSWSLYKKGENVTEQSIITLDSKVVTGSSTVKTINTTEHSSKSFTLVGNYGGLTETRSKTITINDYSYFGIVTDTPTDLSELTSSTLRYGRSYSYTFSNLSNAKVCYAYPTYFGSLTSIKDANNFDYINSYTITELTNSKGVNYYVYTLTNPVTIASFKQSFN